MGIDILCGEIKYRDTYSGFMCLRRIACSATVLYLTELASKLPSERAHQINSAKGIDDEDLDMKTTELIDCGIESTKAMFNDAQICDDAAGEMLWRRHQIFANLGLSGLIDLVFHSDSEGYYTAGMATDILAWWERVGPFYAQAVEQFAEEMPSEGDMQARLDSVAKRFCTGVRVVVKLNNGRDVCACRVERMNNLIAVFHEVVRTQVCAQVC